MKTVAIVGINIVLTIVLIFASVKFVFYDMSNRSTNFETLQPNRQ